MEPKTKINAIIFRIDSKMKMEKYGGLVFALSPC